MRLQLLSFCVYSYDQLVLLLLSSIHIFNLNQNFICSGVMHYDCSIKRSFTLPTSNRSTFSRALPTSGSSLLALAESVTEDERVTPSWELLKEVLEGDLGTGTT